jgi:hypothetical protein
VRLKLTINSGLRTDTLVTACKTFTWNRGRSNLYCQW